MHGYVSDEARDGWYAFARNNDTNVSALLEAFGGYLAELASKKRLPANVDDVVSKAQRIAARRSSRERE